MIKTKSKNCVIALKRLWTIISPKELIKPQCNIISYEITKEAPKKSKTIRNTDNVNKTKHDDLMK